MKKEMKKEDYKAGCHGKMVGGGGSKGKFNPTKPKGNTEPAGVHGKMNK